MKKIVPYLEEGMIYNEACDAAGYDFKADGTQKKSKLLKGEDVTTTINEITNPVVKTFCFSDSESYQCNHSEIW